MAKNLAKKWSWNKAWFEPNAVKSRAADFRKAMRNSNVDTQIRYWETFRTLSDVKIRMKCDISKHVKNIFQRVNRKVDVLDAGAGKGFISAGLVAKFGKTVHVTALSLETPQRTKRLLKYPGITPEHIRDTDYSKGISKVKRITSFFENYSPKKRYDLIIDVFGPYDKSMFRDRVVEQLMNLLRPNGIALIHEVFDARRFNFDYGPTSKYATEAGYYLKIEKREGTIAIIRKIALERTKN